MNVSVHRRRDWQHVPRIAAVVADGEDVTRWCVRFDARRRRVWLLLHDLRGEPVFVDWNQGIPVYERRCKRLKIKWKRNVTVQRSGSKLVWTEHAA